MKWLIKVTQDVLDRSRMCKTMPKSLYLKYIEVRTNEDHNTARQIVNEYSEKQNEASTDLINNCMISLAVQDLFPNAVTNNKYIYPEGYISEYKPRIGLSTFAQNRIREFDSMTPEDRKYIKPFSFEIEVSDEIINLIGISQAYKKLSESKTVELVSI